jgi:hypothetical protein
MLNVLSKSSPNQRAEAGALTAPSEPREARRGFEAFDAAFKPTRMLLVGGDGIPVEEFLRMPLDHWMRE